VSVTQNPAVQASIRFIKPLCQ